MSLFGKKDQPDRSQPGQFGAYYLQELIAHGGMADIWLATNSKRETFSLRRLRDDSFFNFKQRKQFVRGCEILSKIHHNDLVIGYLEHGKIEGSLYLLMEYVEASNLKILLAREDPILGERVAEILIDMALALEHVHTSGFMHLDFKPENVLITRSGSLRLIDFDLARPIVDKPEQAAEYPGTPAYMAPEQLFRKPFDHRVDIFAYGVAAYELLTHRKPFAGDSPEEILRKQIDRIGSFIPPRELNPNIPVALERIVLKCLERDMDKRYRYMSLLRHEVQTALYV